MSALSRYGSCSSTPKPVKKQLLGAGLFAILTASPALLANEPLSNQLPWRTPGSPPLSADARSVEIVQHDELLYMRPAFDASRRGAARLGARLPLFATGSNAGCQEGWLLVGPSAWLCGRAARLSDWPYLAANQHAAFSDGLPYRYYFVGPDGAFGYVQRALAEEAPFDAQFDPGFAVAVTRQEQHPNGEPYALTTRGLWVALRDLLPVNASGFTGVLLSDVTLHDSTPLDTELPLNTEALSQALLPAAWVVAERAPLFDAPAGRTLGSPLDRLTRVEVAETVTKHGKSWLKLASGSWLRSDQVRRARPAEPPVGLAPEEHWIDVDVERQILTAYRGTKPVFATLVSTGRGHGSSEQATPKGEHRIWVKLVSTDMTNLEDPGVDRYYALEDVPWVMFFKAGYGLHGAFWHNSFGTQRSHGCVNLSPRDAQWLFHWASPRLPSGWHAVHPTRWDTGTRVVVR